MKTWSAASKRLWSRLPPLAKGWILSFLCWGFFACLLGMEVGQREDLWQSAIRPGIREWLPWAVFTPFIFRLVHRFPIDRQRWRLALPIHLLSGLAIVLLCQWWKLTVDPHMWLAPPMPPPGAMSAPPMGPPSGPGLGGPGLGGPERGREFFGPRPGTFDLLRVVRFELPIYLMLVSGAHTLTFYRRTQEREASLALARAEAQKMQLQPHFLFNTLNMIAELVHEEPDKADAMLIALSGLLRLTMDTAGEQELPLRREIQFIERYLAIMHARFEDRLEYELAIDPATNAALVPTFLLQPLVENAIAHGLGSQMAGGLISIRSHRIGDTLCLSVRDNGVGLKGNPPGPEGIGLGNTRNRLRELYGEAGRLELHDSGGLTVEITMPFHLA